MKITPSEAEIQRSVMDLLLAERIPAIRLNSGSIRDNQGRPVVFARWMDGKPVVGMSDIMAWIGGRTVFMEIKSATGRQRPSQCDFQRWAEGHPHFTYLLVRDVRQVVEFLKGKEAT